MRAVVVISCFTILLPRGACSALAHIHSEYFVVGVCSLLLSAPIRALPGLLLNSNSSATSCGADVFHTWVPLLQIVGCRLICGWNFVNVHGQSVQEKARGGRSLVVAMAMLSSPGLLACIPTSPSNTKLANLSQVASLSQPPSKKFSSFAPSIRRPRGPVSMSLQMEQDRASPTVELDPPTVLEICIPAESLAGFEADYNRVAASWPSDLATTLDDHKLEDYVSSAHALVRRWLPEKLVSRLERYIHDPNQPPAILIRGFPIDRDLPPTQPDVASHKVGRYMSETWVIGIARIVGQPLTYEYMAGNSRGPSVLVRQIYTTADKVDHVSAEGSSKLLDFHVDFFQVKPQVFCNVLVFIGLRGAPNQTGKTLLCDNRLLYQHISPSDIHLLRTEEITWKIYTKEFSRHVIEGSESHPQINLFEENLPFMADFDDHVHGSDEVKAAYKRVKALAASLAEGVWLGTGDVLLLNQRKALHGRAPYEAKYDGKDRWLQRSYANSGGFWEAGILQWPRRVVKDY